MVACTDTGSGRDEREPVMTAHLMTRPTRPAGDLAASRRRIGPLELQIAVMVAACALLIPWIAYLAVTLPGVWIADGWNRTWVWFDIFLLVLMAITGMLAYQRRQMVMLTAFATGVLLLVDAWFDISLDGSPSSILTAVLVELPLAALLIICSLHLLRLVSHPMGLVAADIGGPWGDQLILPATPAEVAPRPRPSQVRSSK